MFDGLTERADTIHMDLQEMAEIIGETPSGRGLEALHRAGDAIAALDALRRELAWATWQQRRYDGLNPQAASGGA